MQLPIIFAGFKMSVKKCPKSKAHFVHSINTNTYTLYKAQSWGYAEAKLLPHRLHSGTCFVPGIVLCTEETVAKKIHQKSLLLLFT